MVRATHALHVAIACGGTGGHLFPGMAVAEVLEAKGHSVRLFVSPKAVDRDVVRAFPGQQEVTALDAVGLDWRQPGRFLKGLWRSWRLTWACFATQRPDVVLAMGGFTSAAPVLAARRLGIPCFLHESNSIPGRANRWLAPRVHTVFVGFEQASRRLRAGRVVRTGTPVRPAFSPREAAACRRQLGLSPDCPTLLITGGSQGAVGLNRLVLAALPRLQADAPRLQCLHLAGHAGFEEVRAAYAASGLRAVVHPFWSAMEIALGAADVVVSRAGASSLAELAAMRVPAVLVPFPQAADNHQFHNARAYAEAGAAFMVEQSAPNAAEQLAGHVLKLLAADTPVAGLREALGRWHEPDAAVRIADLMLAAIAPNPGARAGATKWGSRPLAEPAVEARR